MWLRYILKVIIYPKAKSVEEYKHSFPETKLKKKKN